MSDEDKVVRFELKPKVELVWCCPCGEQTFYILSSGNARCYVCGLILDMDNFKEHK